MTGPLMRRSQSFNAMVDLNEHLERLETVTAGNPNALEIALMDDIKAQLRVSAERLDRKRVEELVRTALQATPGMAGSQLKLVIGTIAVIVTAEALAKGNAIDRMMIDLWPHQRDVN